MHIAFRFQTNRSSFLIHNTKDRIVCDHKKKQEVIGNIRNTILFMNRMKIIDV